RAWALLRGAPTSGRFLGWTTPVGNAGGTHRPPGALPTQQLAVPADAPRESPGKPYGDDNNSYRVVHVRKNDPDNRGVKPGRYLVDDAGRAKYRTDMPIQREQEKMDNGTEAPKAFDAPQPELFATITRGILGGELAWGLGII